MELNDTAIKSPVLAGFNANKLVCDANFPRKMEIRVNKLR